MARFARILVVALIAVFAAWSSAHVANATTMSLEMAAMDDGSMDMANCDACDPGEPGDQSSLSCDFACVSPVLANLVTSQVFMSAPVAEHAVRLVYDFAGRTYPPDPHPPRAFLLI